MLRFSVRRMIQAILTIFGVVTGTFFLIRLSGDPAELMMPAEASAEDLARFRADLGLNENLFVQYVRFMRKMVTGDFGQSLQGHVPAMGLVIERLPATIELALSAFVLGLGIAFLMTMAIRLTGSERLRAALLWIASVRQAIPIFWFGLLMILIFSIQLRWLPSLGRGTISHLILPALTLATYEIALYLRLFDSSMEQEEQQDYVRTARAKGQTRIAIILQHMLPNALLPLITIAGLNIGFLLGGAVVTETVFSWPGAGRLMLQAVSQRDYPVVIAGIFTMSLIFVGINFLVDLLYATLDPRVRLS